MNQDDRDHALEASYRRASEADAGRPAAATRVAILAEAAAGAAARRRATPAANQSRYWMRAVAGIAVVGVGVLLWRQTDHRLPGEPVTVVESQVQREAAPSAADMEAGAISEAPAPQAPPAVASRRAAEGDAAPTANEQEAANAAGASRELRAEQPASMAEAQQKAAAATVPAPAPMSPAADAPTAAQFVAPATTEADSLLRRHFPAQFQSERTHRLWLVRNAAGEVLQSGELAPGQSLTDLAAQLAGNLAGLNPGAWRTTSVPNANGQLIELSVSEIP